MQHPLVVPKLIEEDRIPHGPLMPGRWTRHATELFESVRCFTGVAQGIREFRLAVFPAGDGRVASVRLRAMPLQDLLRPSSVASGIAPARMLTPDVAWFQKKLTAKRLRIAERLKRSGCIIVYDCDESGSELDYWAAHTLASEMLQLADLVTTDTPEREVLLREIAGACRPQVLENQADFSEQLSRTRSSAVRNGDELRVLWFGYGSNLDSLSEYRDVLHSTERVRLVVCGPRRSEVRQALGDMSVEVRRWSQRGFVDVLRSCDVTLLSHFGSPHHAAKSAHKMITSICHGVPALVSATPDYGRVARLAGVQEDAVYSSPDQLALLLRRMKSAELRRTYIDRARAVLLEHYGPGTFAAAAASLLHDLLARSARPEHVAR